MERKDEEVACLNKNASLVTLLINKIILLHVKFKLYEFKVSVDYQLVSCYTTLKWLQADFVLDTER